MRILGIDPGLNATGYGVVELDGSEVRHVASGTINIPSARPLPTRLNLLFEALREVFDQYHPDEVAVENTFLAKNVAVALKLGQAKGIALLVAEQGKLPVTEYTPTEIKTAVTGYGAAAKEQVQYMVGRLLRLDVEATTHHATDALATAICHLHTALPRRGTTSMAATRRIAHA